MAVPKDDSNLLKTGNVELFRSRVDCFCFLKHITTPCVWTLEDSGLLTQVIAAGNHEKDSEVFDMHVWSAGVPMDPLSGIPPEQGIRLCSADKNIINIYKTPTAIEQADWFLHFQQFNSQTTGRDPTGKALLHKQITDYVGDIIDNATVDARKPQAVA